MTERGRGCSVENPQRVPNPPAMGSARQSRATPDAPQIRESRPVGWQNGDVPKRASAKPGDERRDVALIVGGDENAYHILRQRSEDAPLEAGVLRPLTEGKALTGELVKLRPREEAPVLFDVETELDLRPNAAADVGGDRATGPARVTSDAYRKGWDAIWGDSRPSRSRLN